MRKADEFVRIFRSKIVYGSLDDTIIEYDFLKSTAAADADTVLKAVREHAATIGIDADAVTVREEKDKRRTFIVAQLSVSTEQYDKLMDVVTQNGWAKKAFFDKGIRIVGSRIITERMVSFAIGDAAQRSSPEWQPDARLRFRRGKGFNRRGRHYELSDDGMTWVDTGAAPCCGYD